MPGRFSPSPALRSGPLRFPIQVRRGGCPVKDYVFFVSQVGAKGSAERDRADEVHDGIVAPVANGFDLEVRRADRDPTPGQVSTQIVKALIEATVVVADLTGRNPNVYYELGVAHAFQRPVAILVDKASSLSFDTQNEKVVEIHDSGTVGVNQARDATARLTEVFNVILGEGYAVENLLTAVATAQSLDALAPDNPIASELAAMREQLDEVHAFIRRVSRPPRAIRSPDYELLRRFVEELAKRGAFVSEEIEGLITSDTSPTFDAWVQVLAEQVPKRSPAYPDEEPF